MTTIARNVTAEYARGRDVVQQARMRRVDLDPQGWLTQDQELMLGLLAMLEEERSWVAGRPSIFRDCDFSDEVAAE